MAIVETATTSETRSMLHRLLRDPSSVWIVLAVALWCLATWPAKGARQWGVFVCAVIASIVVVLRFVA